MKKIYEDKFQSCVTFFLIDRSVNWSFEKKNIFFLPVIIGKFTFLTKILLCCKIFGRDSKLAILFHSCC